MTQCLTALFLLGAFGFGALLAIPKRRKSIAELPPWVIEELKRQRQREKVREEYRPRVELPLPEPPPDEADDAPSEYTIDL